MRAVFTFGVRRYVAFQLQACIVSFLRAVQPSGYRDLRAFAAARTGAAVTALVPASDTAAVLRFAERHAHLDLYVGVATRDADDRKTCLALHALFIDADFKSQGESVLRERLIAFPLKPSIVINSGGGLHIYWLLREPLPLTEDRHREFAKLLLRSLATTLGGDLGAAEPSRVLRLPFGHNHKYDPSRAIVVERLRDDISYDLKDFSILVPLQGSAPVDRPRPSAPLSAVIDVGTRHTELMRAGGKLRRLGLQEEEIASTLLTMNQTRSTVPLDVAEVTRIARDCARYAPAQDTFPATETGDAEFFVACHGDVVRFDHRRARWLLFNGHRWVPQTNGEVMRLALDAMRGRQRAAIGNEKRLAHATGGEKRARQMALLAIAENLLPVADTGDNWDLDRWAIGAPNGKIDLLSGRLVDGKPEDRITMSVRVPYEPAAECPIFLKTIAAIFGDDEALIDYIHKALGYSLTGDCREEVFFLLWGAGANGKTTLIGIMAFALGDYADDLPFSALERSRFGGGIPNDIAKLVGRRFVTASESNDVRLNEARIKALTGRDPITARFLHREFFTFEPVAKFWLTANSKPEVRDDSEGFWRRVHLIPFTQSFIGKEDLRLKDKLRAEAPGVLAWLVRGCLAWQRDGLKPPPVVVAATQEYRRESQQLSQFIADCCVLDTKAHVHAGELYKAYGAWCRAEQQPADLNQRTFGEAIRRKFEVREGKTVEYVGLGLLTTDF